MIFNPNEYKNIEALNQSTLKEFMKLECIPKKEEGVLEYYEEKAGLIIGDIVDKMILTNDVEDYYYISKIHKKPSDSIMAIINRIVSLNIDIKDSIEVIREYDYCSHMKDDTVLDKLIKEGEEYYFEIKSAGPFKKIISLEEYNKAKDITDSLLKSKYKEYFENIHRKQVGVVFEMYNTKCKCLLDILYNGDTPVDLKTTHDYAFNFRKAAKSYRYDIQGFFQKKALESLNIKAKNTEFIVVSTTKNDEVVKFNMTDLDMDIAELGTDKVWGVKEAIHKYNLYLQMPKDINTNVESYYNDYNLKLNLYV